MKNTLAALCAVLIVSSAAAAASSSELIMGGGLDDRSDPNAPKSVTSSEITTFSADFLYEGLYVIIDRVAVLQHADTRPIGDYRFTAVRGEKGARITARFSPRDTSLPREDYDFTAPQSALDELHSSLIAGRLPEVNGFAKYNSALGTRFSIDVRYASGEMIRASGRGGASCDPPVDISFLIETFRALVEKYAPAEQRPPRS